MSQKQPNTHKELHGLLSRLSDNLDAHIKSTTVNIR